MNWFSYAEAGDKADPTYQHADSISGIASYYGEHNVYPSHDVSDDFVFVKGNDLFVVGFSSTQDDVLNLAIARAKDQYDSAPDSTIPPAQWPENRLASKSVSSPDASAAGGSLFVYQLILAVVAILIGVVLVRIRRSRRASDVPP